MIQEAVQDLKMFIETTLDEKLDVRFADLKKNMATNASVQELREFTETLANDMMEIMVFLKDTAASKEDLYNVETSLRNEMRAEFIDVRYQMTDMQTSINVLDEKVDKIQVDVARLNRRDEEDIKALGTDIFSLKKRVSSLERK